ncbi:RNB domain-containing ribonuclease [Kutzneria viridogrisea]|uniref:VacB/RNase II family 3'-5' exoribonuclease n=1 Tax=Kutzneria viridogrisea TaxID=47990 RepID=A0ABR6BT63_9PSEU|nr:VacB/RNase II family 3'-5' exoribonuclease [Kutzneria viridogrisea]
MVSAGCTTGGPGRDFAPIRTEFGLPEDFPSAALVEAEQALEQVRGGPRRDATDLPLVTIDPPGSKDLDQAVLVQRRGTGFRVHYAIADLGAFVLPGGALDQEVRRRGQTMYLPDGTVPLHPTVLSEGAASLLPEQVRPAVLWTVDCDAQGEVERYELGRALVRSTARLDYESVQASLLAGTPHPSIEQLPELGRLRRAMAAERGAVELQLPEQQITPFGDGEWTLTVRLRADVEAWNAEVSLLTGMCAAQIMISARVGVLRTLPTADPEAVANLHRVASATGVDWPRDASPAHVLAGLDPDRPESLALYVAATRLLRGAGYTAFDGTEPAVTSHAGVGAPYAHVTAPLRRLVDRFGTECCLAVTAGAEVPEWVRAALPELPGLMSASDLLAGKVERACLDQAEAWVLADRVGEEFDAVVLRAEATGGEVFVAQPPVMARCAGEGLPEGERIRVRLVEADVGRRKVSFDRVGGKEQK